MELWPLRDFCTVCRTERTCKLGAKQIEKTIRDKTYTFTITVAICDECGEEMSLPGLIDFNVKEIDQQYRAIENIITIEEIQDIMANYDLGAKPLSLVLGFGEVTIPRYLKGQVPSHKASNILYRAMTDLPFMESCLRENRDKITDQTYRKASTAIQNLKQAFGFSSKLQGVIALLFLKLKDLTPLALQKLLYYCQAISLLRYNRPLYAEACEAWKYGPVYPMVYSLFVDFRSNPIDDQRFAIFKGKEFYLTSEDESIVSLVADTFGRYSGTYLSQITHHEEPWRTVRGNASKSVLNTGAIDNTLIKTYFDEQKSEFNFNTVEGIEKYIEATYYRRCGSHKV